MGLRKGVAGIEPEEERGLIWGMRGRERGDLAKKLVTAAMGVRDLGFGVEIWNLDVWGKGGG